MRTPETERDKTELASDCDGTAGEQCEPSIVQLHSRGESHREERRLASAARKKEIRTDGR